MNTHTYSINLYAQVHPNEKGYEWFVYLSNLKKECYRTKMEIQTVNNLSTELAPNLVYTYKTK